MYRVPFENSIEALNTAGITTLAKPVSKLGMTELWITLPHIPFSLSQ